MFCNVFLPSPLHSGHVLCICCTMPGPICRIEILMPLPWHERQGCIAPGLPPCLEIYQLTNNMNN